MGVIFTLEGFASLAVSECQWEKAVKLYAWATHMREESGELRPPVEQAAVDRDLLMARSNLAEDECSMFTLDGSTMTMEQAISFALEE